MTVFVGPAQAASRSFLARLIPEGKNGEIFGLYATTGRVVSFMSPVAFGVFIALGARVTGEENTQYWGILGIVLILAAGFAVMLPVKEHTEHRMRDAWPPGAAAPAQPANSKCQGSGREPPAAAHDGWNQPKSGPFCLIQRCAGELKSCTPPHRSSARPRPCRLVPGVAANRPCVTLTEICSGQRAVGVGDAQRAHRSARHRPCSGR